MGDTGPEKQDLFASRTIYTVARLVREMKQALEREFDFVWVEGEVSNLRRPGSGHIYFTLKDAEAGLRAVMFRFQAARLGFNLNDGDQVLVLGRVSVYESRGEAQLVVDTIEPRGLGALQKTFEQLKGKLAAEGLFDAERKKELPTLVERVGLVTSPVGAAGIDFVRTLRLGGAEVKVLLYPVRVQGEAAAAEMIRAVEYFDRRVDVIVLTRGGGSIEDLWQFNDESLARAIGACETPVISAVGHETDFTICDFVADVRAATPTAGAGLLVSIWAEARDAVIDLESRLAHNLVSRIEALKWQVLVARRSLKDPRVRLSERVQRLDELRGRLMVRGRGVLRELGQRQGFLKTRLMAAGPDRVFRRLREGLVRGRTDLRRVFCSIVKDRRAGFSRAADKLDALSPLKVLSRGYAIVRTEPGALVVKSSSQVKTGDRLDVRLGRGSLGCVVERVIED